MTMGYPLEMDDSNTIHHEWEISHRSFDYRPVEKNEPRRPATD